jgi:hypothetical protein
VPVSRRVVWFITVGVNWKAMLWLLTEPNIRPNIQDRKAMGRKRRGCMCRHQISPSGLSCGLCSRESGVPAGTTLLKEGRRV